MNCYYCFYSKTLRDMYFQYKEKLNIINVIYEVATRRPATTTNRQK